MAPIAHASISNTKPLDLANLFGVSESSSAGEGVRVLASVVSVVDSIFID